MANPILATGAIGKPEQIASLWRKGCCRVWRSAKRSSTAVTVARIRENEN